MKTRQLIWNVFLILFTTGLCIYFKNTIWYLLLLLMDTHGFFPLISISIKSKEDEKDIGKEK